MDLMQATESGLCIGQAVHAEVEFRSPAKASPRRAGKSSRLSLRLGRERCVAISGWMGSWAVQKNVVAVRWAASPAWSRGQALRR